MHTHQCITTTQLAHVCHRVMDATLLSLLRIIVCPIVRPRRFTYLTLDSGASLGSVISSLYTDAVNRLHINSGKQKITQATLGRTWRWLTLGILPFAFPRIDTRKQFSFFFFFFLFGTRHFPRNCRNYRLEFGETVVGFGAELEKLCSKSNLTARNRESH